MTDCVLTGLLARFRNTPKFTRTAHRSEVPVNTAKWHKQDANAAFPALPSRKVTRPSCESLACARCRQEVCRHQSVSWNRQGRDFRRQAPTTASCLCVLTLPRPLTGPRLCKPRTPGRPRALRGPGAAPETCCV